MTKISDKFEVKQTSFARVALSGSTWATGQTALNKVVALVSTLIVARCLTPEEFGAGGLAIAFTKFLSFLPPMLMSDVLLTRQRSYQSLARHGFHIALLAGTAVLACSLLVAPFIAAFYGTFNRSSLFWLLILSATRPLLEALQIGPWTTLRIAFCNRQIALVDGSVQLAASCTSILLALAGFGAWAIILPLVGSAGMRGICLRIAAGRRESSSNTSPSRSNVEHQRAWVFKTFALMSSGHYLHVLADSLPLLIIAKLGNDRLAGIFAMAYGLSTQSNNVISSQVGAVLQPILGSLGTDLRRQADGFLRVIQLLGMLAVPISLTQAAFAEPLFALLFEPGWAEAAQVFAVLCIAETFVFATVPTMTMLKSQRRFRLFIQWQVIQILIAIGSSVLGMWLGSLVLVAALLTLGMAVSLPSMIWRITRPSAASLRSVMRLFLLPWASAAPISFLALGVSSILIQYGGIGSLIALLAGAPLFFACMLFFARITQPLAFAELAKPLATLLRRASW